MDLLNELLDMGSTLLNEDLGELKKLGLGKLINALKQTYSRTHTGRGRNSYEYITTNHIGSTFNPYAHSVTPNSPIHDSGKLKNYNSVKNAYKKLADKEEDRVWPTAAAFYLHGKAIAFLIADWSNFSSNKNVIGLAWDFTHTPLTDEQVEEILSQDPSGQYSYNDKRPMGVRRKPHLGHYKAEKTIIHNHPRKSSQTHERYDDHYHTTTINHYEGLAQTIGDVKHFFDKLGELSGGNVEMKLISTDKEAQNKRWNRPEPIPRDQLKLFKDELSVRLAKYKASKVQSVETLEEFVRKVFEGGLKKITFAGHTYNAIPEAYTYGNNKSRPARASEPTRYYTNDTMQRLFKGQTVRIEFHADRASGDYKTLDLYIKFSNGQLVPVKATYHDGNSKEPYGSVTVEL